MSRAPRQQPRRAPHARRALAAITGLWLVAFAVLGTRHESRVAHYVDAHTGRELHASAMAGDHKGSQSDVHAARDAASQDACAVFQTLHQASSTAVAPIQLQNASVLAIVVVPPAARASTCGGSVFRLAPKTSPPLAA